MSVNSRRALGKRGEEEALRFLRRRGYRVLEKNVRLFCGEIDLIARHKGVLCFIEVRARRGHDLDETRRLALESVHEKKQRRLLRLALYYLKEKGLGASRVRFDVVAVVCRDENLFFDLVQDAFRDEAR